MALIILFLTIITLLFSIIFIAWSANKTLLRGGVAWSAKELPIKRKQKLKGNSLLEEIENESNQYLKEQKSIDE